MLQFGALEVLNLREEPETMHTTTVLISTAFGSAIGGCVCGFIAGAYAMVKDRRPTRMDEEDHARRKAAVKLVADTTGFEAGLARAVGDVGGPGEEVTHLTLGGPASRTECCGLLVADLDPTDFLTASPLLVTCSGR